VAFSGNITSIVDGVNGNENRTLTYDARDRMSGTVAPNIYGQELVEYDVLDNVRRLAGGPNGTGGYGQESKAAEQAPLYRCHEPRLKPFRHVAVLW